MQKRARRGESEYKRNLRLWTVLCLVIVCAAAIALRGVVVYRLYPLDYKEEIVASSSEYSLDKYLVCAVIYAESSFNEKAVSRKGAVGLMQIMPETGEWAAGKIGLKGYAKDILPEPEVNIAIGCWYLGSYLNERFDGDLRKILAAYNAGPNKVSGWLDSEGKLSDIPYKETKDYVEKVLRYYEIYKGLYKDF